MEEIIGTQIISDQYGIGTITSISDTMIMSISFPEVCEKRFMYPDAFCKSIQSEDTIIQEDAEAAWLIKLEKKKAEEAAMKEAEDRKKRYPRKHLTPEEIESKKAELQHILEGIDCNEQFTESTSRIFIVHQGKTFFEEYTGEYIWAPESGIHHHERMTEIRKGDIIVNNCHNCGRENFFLQMCIYLQRNNYLCTMNNSGLHMQINVTINNCTETFDLTELGAIYSGVINIGRKCKEVWNTIALDSESIDTFQCHLIGSDNHRRCDHECKPLIH